MEQFVSICRRYPLPLAVIAIVVSCVVILYGPFAGDAGFGGAATRFVLSAFCLGILYLISGKKSFDTLKGTGLVVRACIPFLVIALLGLVFSLISLATASGAEARVGAGFAANIPAVLLLAISVGLFEEILFRAVVNDAVLCQFKSSKWAFVVSAVVVFVIFGAVHDLSSLNAALFQDPVQMLQAVLKITQTGFFGLGLLFLFWKTRNIWACALVHFLNDFFLMLPGAISGTEASFTYVQAGSNGISIIVTYAVLTIIEALICLWIWRKHCKSLDFEQLRKSW